MDYRDYRNGSNIADVVVDQELEIGHVDQREVPCVKVLVRMRSYISEHCRKIADMINLENDLPGYCRDSETDEFRHNKHIKCQEDCQAASTHVELPAGHRDLPGSLKAAMFTTQVTFKLLWFILSKYVGLRKS